MQEPIHLLNVHDVSKTACHEASASVRAFTSDPQLATCSDCAIAARSTDAHLGAVERDETADAEAQGLRPWSLERCA